MADIISINHIKEIRERNWWKYHDKREKELLEGNEDLQLLKDMVDIADEYHEALIKIASLPNSDASEIARAVLNYNFDTNPCPYSA